MRAPDLHPDLDPELASIVPDLNPDVIAMLRETGLGGPAELSDAVDRTDHVVSEDPHVVVRVHRPVGLQGPCPALYSIHGGGYVLGSFDMDDATFDRLCPELGIVGVSVEYRLAPEHPYPAAIDDCEAGLRWTFTHAEELGIDPDRVGITGVSAGGGLCAALGLRARDAGLPVRFQLLDCPMLDDRLTSASSQFEDLVIWSRTSNQVGWRSYLGDLADDEIPADAAPARAEKLDGLPPSYVCVGGADGFRDEDLDFAQRLMTAGVETELHVYPGVPHGVRLWVGSEPARRYGEDQVDWLRRQFDRLRDEH
ncbi:MAG: alpha/beta hydrolase [Acidimicrobiales bacterium]|nr:alpha/beta hydrolase [Acidimicrobiales bacterium]